LTRRAGVAPAMIPGILIMLIGPRIGDAFNLLYNILLGRWLGNGEFGQALAIIGAISIPAGAVSVLICRETVRHCEAGGIRAMYQYATRWFVGLTLLGAAGAGLIVLLGPYVGTIFRYQSQQATLGLALLFIITMTRPVWGAVIHGQQRFVLLGLGPALEGLLRFAFTAALLLLGWQLLGVVYAQALAGMLLIAWAWYYARRYRPASVPAIPAALAPQASSLATLGHSVVTTVALALWFWVDLAAVNYIFPGPVADGYGGVATIGKIVCYAPESLSIILMPLVMRNALRSQDSRRHVYAGLAATVLATAVLVSIYAIWGTAIIRLYNKAFVAWAPLLPKYALAMGFLSLARVCATYDLARGRFVTGWLLMALVPCELALFYLLRRTVNDTVNMLLLASVAAALLALLSSFLPRRSKPCAA
jgi:O-antigen/teichoic acid export membrane protein